MTGEKASGQDENQACNTSRQPLIDEVCAQTQQLLEKSDLFTSLRAKAIAQLMATEPEKLKTADLLAMLSADEEGLPK